MRRDGSTYCAGDYDIPFTMQSISKTFSLILALQTAGYDKVFSKIGMEPTGDRFDSILQLELKDWRPFNPMINAWRHCHGQLHRDPGSLCLLPGTGPEAVRQSPHRPEPGRVPFRKKTGTRNRSIAFLLKSDNVLDGEPEEILDVFPDVLRNGHGP